MGRPPLKHVQDRHGEGGLRGGEVGLFGPPEALDIVIQQDGFLHADQMVPEAQDLGHRTADNREHIWINNGAT
ncbi:hypothetical protein EYF80_049982 [Liparis tanakae]|uniref:Uncharacterized protein n=1 Tax=Liparis tanakae TaxID=230148 RepID=A0A4Z2FFX2_9TELE|nr:hypothetical protein EYF80_049982 [Liparis tanakae]